MFIVLKSEVDTPNVERVTFLGRKHLKVPVIGFVEGVATPGNVGEAELGLMSEFQKSLEQWNGRPVTLNHPMETSDDGPVAVSANSDGIYDNYAIGLLFGAVIDTDKFKINAYLDIERCKELSTDAEAILTKLESGEINEVSTGFNAQTERKSGKFKDNSFSGIWRNIIPDHLAFLVSVPGACSVEDGCGAGRTNAAAVETAPSPTATQAPQQVQNGTNLAKPALVQVRNNVPTTANHSCSCPDKLKCSCDHSTSEGNTMTIDNAKLIGSLKGLTAEALKQLRDGGITLNTEGMADTDRRQAIYAALDGSDFGYYVITAVYPKSFVAQSWYDGDCKEFPFSEDAKGNITIDFDNAASVRPMTQYVPITTENSEQKGSKTMSTTPTPGIKALSFEEALEQMNPEAKAIALQGKQVLDAKRVDLKAKILTAPGNKFSDAQIVAMDITTLEGIAAVISVPATPTPAAPAPVATAPANTQLGAEPKACGGCGSMNTNSSKFCNSCGDKMGTKSNSAPAADYRANGAFPVINDKGEVVGHIGMRVQSEDPEQQAPKPKTLDEAVREKRGLKAVA